MSLNTFTQLLTDMMQGRQVPFTGEPLKPIQIMGMLESRALDFEHVVVLSCNENLLPKGKSQQSMLPFDARIAFGIPTHFQQDAAYAYTFYRLLNRAKNIYLVYTTDSEAGKSSEKSRFLHQIEHELKDFPNIKIQQLAAKLALPDAPNAKIIIKKKKKTVRKTLRFLQLQGKGLTSSSISLYLRNPYQFFLHKIFNVTRDAEIEEDIEMGTFGNLIHAVLQRLFEVKIGKLITAQDLEEMAMNQDLIRTTVDIELNKAAGEVVCDTGKNYLLTEVACEMLTHYLRKEKENAPFRILATEIILKYNFPILLGGKKFDINLNGKIDRIDLNQNNEFVIVDYKTGDVKRQALNFEGGKKESLNLSAYYYDKERINLTQLLIYQYLLLQNPKVFEHLDLQVNPEFSNIKSGYWSFRNIEQGFLSFNYQEALKNESKFIHFMEDFISKIIKDMLNRKKDITEIADVMNKNTKQHVA